MKTRLFVGLITVVSAVLVLAAVTIASADWGPKTTCEGCPKYCKNLIATGQSAQSMGACKKECLIELGCIRRRRG
jgi:hypothetical protein